MAIIRGFLFIMLLGFTAQASGFANPTLDSLEKSGWRYLANNQLEKADSVAYLLLHEIQKAESVTDTFLSNSYFLLGTLEFYKGRFRISASFFKKILNLPLSKKNPAVQLKIYNNLGAALSNLGELPEALAAYQKALKISKAQNSREGILSLSINMADLEFDLGNYKSAIGLIQKVMEDSLTASDKAYCHLNLGKYYVFDNQVDKGLWHTQEALRQFEALEDQFHFAAALVNLAKVQQIKKEYELSDKTIQKVVDISKANKYDKYLLPALIHFSQNTILSGRNLQKAKGYATEAIKLAQESGKRDHLETSTLELSKYYAAVNDMERFLQTIDTYNKVKNETVSLNAKVATEELKVIYAVDQLTGKIVVLEENLKSKNQQLVVTILILFFAFLGGSIIYIQYRKLRQNMKTMFRMNVSLAYAEHGDVQIPEEDFDNATSEAIEESDVELYRIILRKMELNSLYKDPQFNLQQLVKLVRRNRNLVSRAIKNCGKTNFFGMINELKVNEVRRLILKRGSEISLGDIAKEAGFTSRASFNRNFKELTGFTPTAYLDMCNKNLIDDSEEVED